MLSHKGCVSVNVTADMSLQPKVKYLCHVKMDVCMLGQKGYIYVKPKGIYLRYAKREISMLSQKGYIYVKPKGIYLR